VTPPEENPTEHDGQTPAAVESEPSQIPSGNLFEIPKLTTLDPADKDERRGVERLLESLNGSD